jgi:RNA polymerase-binding transcription factor DksA
MEELDRIRRELEARHAALRRRVGRIEAHRRHEGEPLDEDFEEQAVEQENDEVLDGLGESGSRELEAIGRALARIDEGTFGTCTRCGEPIPPARLRVMPTAETCVPCSDGRGDHGGES